MRMGLFDPCIPLFSVPGPKYAVRLRAGSLHLYLLMPISSILTPLVNPYFFVSLPLVFQLLEPLTPGILGSFILQNNRLTGRFRQIDKQGRQSAHQDNSHDQPIV